MSDKMIEGSVYILIKSYNIRSVLIVMFLFAMLFTYTTVSAFMVTIDADNGNAIKSSTSTITLDSRFFGSENGGIGANANVSTIKRIEMLLNSMQDTMLLKSKNASVISPHTNDWILEEVSRVNAARRTTGVSNNSDDYTGALVQGGACGISFTTNYRIGARGSQVMAIQRLLNSNPQTRIAGNGPGSLGGETDYYGRLTDAAVKRFQVLYANEVLTPAGLEYPTGFWGPSTRRMANRLTSCGNQ